MLLWPRFIFKILKPPILFTKYTQSASLDVEEIVVNATDEAEFESLLAANDQLFDFHLLTPLKRSLFEITMEDIKEIISNKTQPRSLDLEGRQGN